MYDRVTHSKHSMLLDADLEAVYHSDTSPTDSVCYTIELASVYER